MRHIVFHFLDATGHNAVSWSLNISRSARFTFSYVHGSLATVPDPVTATVSSSPLDGVEERSVSRCFHEGVDKAVQPLLL